jgi:hypothetical protein
MNITRMPATITQVVLTLETVSLRLGPLAADAAAGSARAAANAAAEPRRTRIRARTGGAAPVARLNMDSSYVGFRRTSPGGGDLNTAAKLRPQWGGVIGHVSEISAARFALRSKRRWTSGRVAPWARDEPA